MEFPKKSRFGTAFPGIQKLADQLLSAVQIAQRRRVQKGELKNLRRDLEAVELRGPTTSPEGLEDGDGIGRRSETDIPNNKRIGRDDRPLRDPLLGDMKLGRLGHGIRPDMHGFPMCQGFDASGTSPENNEFKIHLVAHGRNSCLRP